MPHQNKFWCLILTVALATTAAQTDDWPRFRGPGGLGTSPDAHPPTQWDRQQNVLWTTDLPGPGTSSPVLFGDSIFLTCYTGYNLPGRPPGNMADLKLHLLRLDRYTGHIRWTKDIAPRLPEQPTIRDGHGYASATPAVDAERVYCFFGKSGVIAFDHDGKQLWQTFVGDNLNGWGSAASPVLHGDLVIVNASVESESLVALNRATGQEIWRAKGIRESWNTPILVTNPDGQTELVVAIFGRVLGIDPATGKQLWSCATDITWYMVPSLVAHDGVVYCVGGRGGGGALAVRTGGRGDVTTTHRLWMTRKGSNVPSPVYHNGHLYWINESNAHAYCADAATGTVVYEERVGRADTVYASALLADSKVYYLDRQGRTFVVAAKPEFDLLATNDLRDGSTFNASPVALGNRLYIRSDKALYCIGTPR
jgi:outer membrane protein assembly factor BamB